MMIDISSLSFAEIQNFMNTATHDLNIIWGVLVTSCMCFLLAGYFMLRSRRRFVKQLNYIADLQKDIRAITAAAIGVGERVLEIERRQRRLSDRQEQLDIYDSANQPYEQAISMIRHGADVSELIDVCGISKSEAELLALMNRLDQTA